MDFFKILNGGIGVSMSNFDRLWAKKYSGWPKTELTGSLPLSFLSKGEALTDYRIYGTESGAGVQTENLWDFSASTKGLLKNDGSTDTNKNYSTSDYIPVTAGQPYIFRALSGYTPGRFAPVAWYDSNKQFVDYSNAVIEATIGSIYTRSYTAPNDASYARVSGLSIYDSEFMLTSGSTAPTSYIPYGYKIPISNTSGEQQSNYDLFIGDSKLGEEEYLDYGEQKIYKDVSGTLTPTDPPAPLPTINTYKGENTLSSEETVGEVTIKGKIKETT